MERLTTTKTLALYYEPILGIYFVGNWKINTIVFECHEFRTLTLWAVHNNEYDAEELSQIVGTAAMFITEQGLRYKNLLDSIFQNNDTTNEA
jgi:hypothetical protein